MIELERHIEILLLDNDCVIVPGLGGFMAHHIEARFDDRDNMFLPPMRMLGFNPKLNMNDSLLAQSYVEAYDISYPEALNRIDAEVDELKQSIERDGFYELNDIGVITLNAEGNYEFEPCESGVLTPRLYGLAGVEIEKIATDGDAVRPVSVELPLADADAVASRTSVSATSAAEGEKKAKVLPFGANSGLANKIAAENESAERTISIKVSLLRNVLAVACAIVAFFMLATPISTDVYENGKKISSISGGLLYNLIPKDGSVQSLDVKNTRSDNTVKLTVSKENMKLQASPASSAPAEIKETKGETAVASACQPSSNYYCIVLAARITKSNAEAYAEKLRAKGYDKVRVLDEKGESLKVVYGEYKSEPEAFSKLNELRDNESFEGCWIYHVK